MSFHGPAMGRPMGPEGAIKPAAKFSFWSSMADLARVSGVGVSHFRALFGRSFGQPPHRYVIERRLARARVLIEADAAPLAEVALMAGFSHQSHLARWMRRLEGVTPGELRRKL